jgi:hypothetical protein
MATASPADRRALRGALRRRFGWIDDPDIGPRTVEAGECDRCGAEARLVATCGPTAYAALGRRCARELGSTAWCEGHADDARAWVRRLEALPASADTVARLWWVATGEVRVDPADVAHMLDALALPRGPR